MAVPQRTLTLLRRLSRTNGQGADDTVRTLAASWVQAWADLDPAWQQAITAVVDEYQRTGTWPPAWRMARIEAIASAQRQTERSLATLAVEAAAASRAAVARASDATLVAQPSIIGSQRAGLEVERPRRAITDAMVRNRQDRVTLLHRPISASSLAAIQRVFARAPTAGSEPLGELLHRRIRAGFDTSLVRATTIARTETVEAARETAALVDRINARLVTGWCWLSLLQKTTCIACWAMHGTTHPLEQEGPEGHPSCIPAGASVFGPRTVASTTRWFTGQLIDIKTASGNNLSVTPNHPVLTTHGWVPAGDLREGHNVVSALPRQRKPLGTPNDYQEPSLIEDVARSFDSPGSMASICMPTAPVDFHGDGVGSDVHVVRADRLLLDDIKSGLAQPLGEGLLISRHMIRGPLDARLYGQRFLAQALEGHAGTPDSLVRSHRVAPIFGRGSSCHHEPGRFGSAPKFDASIDESPLDGSSGTAHRLGDAIGGFAAGISAYDLVSIEGGFGQNFGRIDLRGKGIPLGSGAQLPGFFEMPDQGRGAYAVPSSGNLGRFASEVITDRITHISRREFSGHVYNLQTTHGWYVANGIVTHNCRCTRLPLVGEEGIPSAERAFRRLPRRDQIAILGPTRFELLRSGRIDWADLAQRRANPGWRDSFVPTSVTDLSRLADLHS